MIPLSTLTTAWTVIATWHRYDGLWVWRILPHDYRMIVAMRDNGELATVQRRIDDQVQLLAAVVPPHRRRWFGAGATQWRHRHQAQR